MDSIVSGGTTSNPGPGGSNSFDRPYVISWNLTYRCNLACEHCYLDAGGGPKVATEAFADRSELGTEECFEVIDQIAEFAPECLTILTGGEPLLRRDILEIVRRASERGLWVVVGTNGVRITENLARLLAEAGARGLSLSLDALDADRHDRFRQVRGAFRNTVEGAAILSRVGLPFIVQTTAASHNIDELDAIADFAHERLAARVWNLYFLVPTGRGQFVSDIAPDQYDRVLGSLYRIRRRFEGRMLVNAKCAPHFVKTVLAAATAGVPAAPDEPPELVPGATSLPARPHRAPDDAGWSSFAEERSRSEPGEDRSAASAISGTPAGPGSSGSARPASSSPDRPRKGTEADPVAGVASSLPFLRTYAGGAGGCPAGTHYMGIRPNGDMTPCPYLPVFAGNLRSERLEALWSGSELFRRIRQRADLGGRCGDCELGGHCGGCRARAYGASGDLMAEDPLCTHQPGTFVDHPLLTLRSASSSGQGEPAAPGGGTGLLEYGESVSTASPTAVQTAGGSADPAAGGSANPTAAGNADLTPAGNADPTAGGSANLTAGGGADPTAGRHANLAPAGEVDLAVDPTVNRGAPPGPLRGTHPSNPSGAAIAWDDAASERMKRIPAFVRGMVVRAVEDSCRKRGLARVTLDELDRIRSRMPTPKLFGGRDETR